MKNPNLDIHIIDSAPFFGGVMWSFDINGFVVDKGVHSFNSVPRELSHVLSEIMNGDLVDFPFISRSKINGKITKGFSLPDLSNLLDEKQRSQVELEVRHQVLQTWEHPPQSLFEAYMRRYGHTAGSIFSDIFESIYALDTRSVEPSALIPASTGRLKFGTDEEMNALKDDPLLDAVIAARRQTIGKVDDFVSVYPGGGVGMKGWCIKTQEYLQARGVSITLGAKILSISDEQDGVCVATSKGEIQAEYLVWANDSTDDLASALGIKLEVDNLKHGVPMLFYTFFTQYEKINDLTYFQNFDSNRMAFRAASSGRFSGQVNEKGESFVIAECPTEKGGRFWNDGETYANSVWNEIVENGIVDSTASMIGYDLKRVPTSVKWPKIGYECKYGELKDAISEKHERIVFRDPAPFFRRDIYLDSALLSGAIF